MSEKYLNSPIIVNSRRIGKTKEIKMSDITTNGRIDFSKINAIDPFMFVVPPYFKQVKTISKEAMIVVMKNA